MKEIKQQFKIRFNGKSILIDASSTNSPFFMSTVYGSVSTKELKELAQRIIEIADEIDNDKDFRKK